MSDKGSEHEKRFFFDEHQKSTIEAAMSRIIPTDHQPGAKEAGAVEFVDRYLSGIDFVWAKPDGSGFEELSGKTAEAWRQRIDSLCQVYTKGIEDLDGIGNDLFNGNFRSLTEAQQDRVLEEMERHAEEDTTESQEDKAASGYGAPAEAEPSEPAMQQSLNEGDLTFFPLLVLHTRQGFYSDPIYGGNRDRIGWEVIGFPGPESLSEVHSGSYTTLPYFAESDPKETNNGG